MRKSTLIILFLGLITLPNTVKSQVNTDYARSSFAEKIYLQLDNNVYAIKSTLWFKAVVVNAATLGGNFSSGVLYVDLIDNQGNVVENKLVKLTEGIGNGYFDIDENWGTGQYLLRAYTTWNKNFSEDFIFKKQIQIVFNDSNKITNDITYISDDNLSDSIDPKILGNYDVQFFPEGGQIINGISSVVAFKAIGSNGKGLMVEGKIIDGSNNVLNRFKSNALGLGHFTLEQPNIRTTYRAVITKINDMDTKKIVSFPKIQNDGSSLKVYASEDIIQVKLQSTLETNDFFLLNVSSRGIDYKQEKVNRIDNGVTLNVPKNDLPEGIVVFSLIDSKDRIVAERLFYNNNSMSRATLNATINKQVFSPREEVVISAKAKAETTNTTDNTFSTSVLVLDKSLVDIAEFQKENILTSLLFTSDLKGHIEAPSVYFREDNAFNIDDLMLTQGWRNYVYDDNMDMRFQHRKELGLPIKGVITRNGKDRSQITKDFTVMDFNSDVSMFNTKITIPGSFYFEIDNLFGEYNNLLMEPLNTSDKERKKINIVVSQEKPLPVNYEFLESLFIENSSIQNIVKKQTEIIHNENEYFENLYGRVRLDEVTVYGYKMTPKREEVAKEFGLPDTVIEGKDIRGKIGNANGLVDVLMAFRDKVFVGPINNKSIMNNTYLRIGTNQGGKGHINMVIVDGIPVNKFNHYLIEQIDPMEVTSLEIIDQPKRLKTLYPLVFNSAPPANMLLGSIISIYTRNGKGLYGALTSGPDQNIINVRGFSTTKEFYVPKYEFENGDMAIVDARQTIYWNPHLQTENSEKKLIKFSHSDNQGEFIVILETISKNGKIGYKQLEYKVTSPSSN